MKTLTIILILIALFPKQLRASDFKTVTDPLLIRPFVNILKKVTPRFSNLNPRWVKKIEVNQNLSAMLVSDCDIDLPYNLTDDQNYEFPIVGSGGCALTVVIKKKGIWSKAFNQQVISYHAEINTDQKVIKLRVYVHGSEFGKSGYEYQEKTVVIKL